MEPRIVVLKEKKLVGNRVKMSVSNNLTLELWANFMPHRKEIRNSVSAELISMQVYGTGYFKSFDPTKEFEKWATIEVTDFNEVPGEMDSFTLRGGLCAVFDYKGSSSDSSIFQYIYNSWLPFSNYQLEDRPHFEVLGEKYKNNNPESEEEIWIPIIKKQKL